MYRAGADLVTGAEVGQHMCDVAAEAVVMNGYAAKCLMINKDVRRMDAAAKANGTPPDMEQKANVCVFEVCTCLHLPALKIGVSEQSLWLCYWDCAIVIITEAALQKQS